MSDVSVPVCICLKRDGEEEKKKDSGSGGQSGTLSARGDADGREISRFASLARIGLAR